MIAINAAAQLVALGGVVLLQAAYSILIARILGVEDFGRFAFAFSIPQILLIGCDLGLHNTAILKISADLKNSHTLFSTFFYLKLAVSSLLVLVVIVLSLVLRETREIQITLCLLGFGMFLHSLNAVLNITFQAHGKLYLASLNQVLISFFQFVIGITLLALGGRLICLGFAYLAAVLIAFVINWRIFQKQIYTIRLQAREGWKEFIRESLPVGVGTFFNTISARIGVTLLTLLSGSYQTGIYSASFRIHLVLTNFPLAVFSAVLPAMASSGEDREPVKRLFRKSAGLMVVISVPLAIVLFVLSRELIGLLYGEQYQLSAENLRILAWSLIPLFLGMAFSHVMLSQKSLVRRLPAVAAAGMIINIGVNLVLIPRMESLGAAVSTLITEAALAVFYALGVWRFLDPGSRRSSKIIRA